MIRAFKANWPNYLIEAWALGMFMLSATIFAGLLELPALPVRQNIADPVIRRWLMGGAMGMTAIALIYSGWGRRSGAHMNPAVTLTFWLLKKIDRYDALWYVAAQFAGGTAAMLLFKALFPAFAAAPEVNFVQTQPGAAGPVVAFAAEAGISFGLFLTILYASNYEKTAPYTGVFAGLLLLLYIALESPLSGTSMNPARSIASAVAAGDFRNQWIFLTAPVLGMLAAGKVWKWWICKNPAFRCSYHG
ncbi:MAG: aquaporin [Lewinellaceae bacterium]|nr:aquaporin [Lewinellaceae bacterium]